MTLPAGVTVEQWAAALRVIGHPWREGQKCSRCKNIDHYRASVSHMHLTHQDHDIPMPAVTDELLMRCVVALFKRNRYILSEINQELVDDDNLDLAGAIIRRASRKCLEAN